MAVREKVVGYVSAEDALRMGLALRDRASSLGRINQLALSGGSALVRLCRGDSFEELKRMFGEGSEFLKRALIDYRNDRIGTPVGLVYRATERILYHPAEIYHQFAISNYRRRDVVVPWDRIDEAAQEVRTSASGLRLVFNRLIQSGHLTGNPRDILERYERVEVPYLGVGHEASEDLRLGRIPGFYMRYAGRGRS